MSADIEECYQKKFNECHGCGNLSQTQIVVIKSADVKDKTITYPKENCILVKITIWYKFIESIQFWKIFYYIVKKHPQPTNQNEPKVPPSPFVYLAPSIRIWI